MSTQIIDGKKIAADLRAGLTLEVAKLKNKYNKVPGLAVIIVGEDPASEVYVRNKTTQTREIGMNSYEFRYSDVITQQELLKKIDELNNDDNVHGILVQLPLPKHIDQQAVINKINCAKDVDGFTYLNAGKLGAAQLSNVLIPCTPLGCIKMIKSIKPNLRGLNAVVIGRSNIVGRPMAQLLLLEDCTVTITHRYTEDVPKFCREADILVVAVGIPNMVKKEWIKPGAIVIDVGINRITDKETGKNRLVGDVDYNDCFSVSSAITPVPGGVGPMTIACLLENTVTAFKNIMS